jgi:hypothetical protein
MKILIIATPRSGSTTLTNVIAGILKYTRYHEPYNFAHPSLASQRYPKELPSNVVVKTMFNQLPQNITKDIESSHNFYDKEIQKFDKVIILSRKDIISAYESFNFRAKKDPFGNWHSSYTYEEVDFDTTLFKEYLIWTNNIMEFAIRNNLPITWYENLFSESTDILTSTVNSWELGITVEQVKNELKKTSKYRAEIKIKTLI